VLVRSIVTDIVHSHIEKPVPDSPFENALAQISVDDRWKDRDNIEPGTHN
jgi:hypothetical protein